MIRFQKAIICQQRDGSGMDNWGLAIIISEITPRFQGT